MNQMMSRSRELFTKSNANDWLPKIVGILLGLFLTSVANIVFPTTSYAWMYGTVLVTIAIGFLWKGEGGVTFLRWWARTFVVVIGILVGTILMSSMLEVPNPQMNGWPLLLEWIAWLLVVVGIIMALVWEGTGEIISGVVIALGSLELLVSSLVQTHAGFNGLNSYLSIFILAGLALVYCGWRRRHLMLVHNPA